MNKNELIEQINAILEKVDDEKRKAATMTGTSFLGGLGVGLLVMWLIMR